MRVPRVLYGNLWFILGIVIGPIKEPIIWIPMIVFGGLALSIIEVEN